MVVSRGPLAVTHGV